MTRYAAWLEALSLPFPQQQITETDRALRQVLFEAQGRGAKNKAVDLEDVKFHQCVRLARFENDRTISFIPPDGAFDLM